MIDSDFLKLGPDEAYKYAVDQEASERVRLLKLFRKVTGEGAYPPSSGATDESAPEYSAYGGIGEAGAKAPTSTMLTLGRAGFVVSLIIIGLAILVVSGGNGSSGLALLLPALSLIGLFAFMWMMGALEMRLIEIHQTLNRNRGGQ